MVSERGLDVLRAIVQDYVASREPVGSRTIVDRYSFGVSAATIRNDMAALEEDGLIVAPHTSSGRVPTDKGYRLFVDHLDEVRALSTAQRLAIRTFLEDGADLDDVLARTVRMLSQLTHQVALVQIPVVPRSYVRHVELVSLSTSRLLVVLITDAGRVDQRVVELQQGDPLDEVALAELRARINTTLVGRLIADVAPALDALAEELAPGERPAVERIGAALAATIDDRRQDRFLLAGTANLARTERDFPGSILPVLEAIEEQVVLMRLFREMELDEHGVSVSIGRENPLVGLAETSILAGGYRSSAGEVARLGVLGPTRMDYSGNIAAVRAVARYLSKLLGEE
jgi:heat-inducible transcriptional repressor